jgi:hypothetical protein
MPKMKGRKEKLTPASPPNPLEDRKLEHFVLWARDGGRVAEIEVPLFRPRVEVLLWQGRSFLWHEKTRRYVEAVSFVVTIKPNKRQSQLAENSFRFDASEPDA